MVEILVYDQKEVRLNYEQNIQVILDFLKDRLSSYVIDNMNYSELQLTYDKLTKEHYG